MYGENSWSNICLCGATSRRWLSIFFLDIKLSRERFMAAPHFSEISTFSQIKEAPGRLLSVSVEYQISSAQNNPYAKIAYSGVTYSGPLRYLLVKKLFGEFYKCMFTLTHDRKSRIKTISSFCLFPRLCFCNSERPLSLT